MASFLENLITRRDAIGVELATIATRPQDYKSDAGSGRKGTLESYRLQLYQELQQIQTQIQFAQGPFEIESQGI